MGVEHSVDSEDLVHCDLMAICAFFVALLMRGLQFKQALAVVNRIGNFVSTIEFCSFSIPGRSILYWRNSNYTKLFWI